MISENEKAMLVEARDTADRQLAEFGFSSVEMSEIPFTVEQESKLHINVEDSGVSAFKMNTKGETVYVLLVPKDMNKYTVDIICGKAYSGYSDADLSTIQREITGLVVNEEAQMAA